MKLTNPYIRALATRPELAQEAAIKLEEREDEPELAPKEQNDSTPDQTG